MGEDNLPAVWNGENVPIKAYDIGDTDERANPRACDLGYFEGGDVSVANNFAGEHVMYDESNDDAHIHCDPDTFITDVRQMA